jgi:2'-5' RNA ligase
MIHLLKGFLIMKRLFVAIKILPQQRLLNTFYDLKKELKHEKINWVNEENLHFTLKFIGNTHAIDIQKVIEPLEDIALNTETFELEVEDLGVFGSRYKPRVIWAGIKKNTSLYELGENVLSGLDEAGFKRDRQNFVPHITLGRIKYIRNKNRLKEMVDRNRSKLFQKNLVKSFYLYESVLLKEGPSYEVVKSFNLQ